ncbi:hypothetical protein [Bifidobacterium sp.]|uniref:hypothetical protein n=1 Tax=Bifidobacterium sp. TaxID=41200 RepID=UPI0025BEE948|nr:hypothetical protein [Bifidobacterium sp.]MCH4208945.1 hypothetical protein [Bifidobacterium sp.]MCI1225525.1 hypothetical protein [Bifidobacterium sp.]
MDALAPAAADAPLRILSPSPAAGAASGFNPDFIDHETVGDLANRGSGKGLRHPATPAP